MSDAGTIFQGWSRCASASPSAADKRRMLACVKNHRCCGGVISRHRAPVSRAAGEPKSPVVITMIPPGLRWSRRQRLARLRQVLDDVEQRDDVDLADPLQIRRVRRAVQHVQPRAVRVRGGLLRELDPGDVEIARRLFQKKSVGASQLEQLAAAAIAADEIDAAGELAAQHRLGAEIVGVAVGAAAGKIVLGVVGGGIERSRLRAAEPTLPALQDVAAVDAEAKRMRRRAAAGWTRAGGLALRRRDLWCASLQDT